jgi:hypothetical protein
MRRALAMRLAVVGVMTLGAVVSGVGIAYWAMARRVGAGNAHPLDGIPSPTLRLWAASSSS